MLTMRRYKIVFLGIQLLSDPANFLLGCLKALEDKKNSCKAVWSFACKLSCLLSGSGTQVHELRRVGNMHITYRR